MDEANCLALKAGEAVKEQRQGRELELQRRIAQESRNPPLVENFHNHTIMEEPPPSPLISENRRPVAFNENHDPEMNPESPNTPLNSEDAFTRVSTCVDLWSCKECANKFYTICEIA